MQVKPFDVPGIKYAVVEQADKNEACVHCHIPIHRSDLVCISQEGNAVICWACVGEDLKRLVNPHHPPQPRIIV